MGLERGWCFLESALYNEMYAVEENHWWFRARRDIVCSMLTRHLRPSIESKPRLLDLGCGCGANLAAYAHRFDAWGLDMSPMAAAYTSARVGARVCLGALPRALPFRPGSFDAVVMTDVLEHLDEDRSAAAHALSLVREGGILLATVPAGQWLYAPRDAVHHHRRRYGRRCLRALFDGLPARIELLSHYNFALFAPSAMVRLVSRFRKHSPTRDLNVPPRFINRALTAIFGVERYLLPWMRLPIGLSLICVVRKLATTGPSGAVAQPRRIGVERALPASPLTAAR